MEITKGKNRVVSEEISIEKIKRPVDFDFDPIYKAIRLILNILFASVMLFPFIYAVIMSLKPAAELYSGHFFPTEYTLDNYVEAFRTANIGKYIVNSLIVSVIITVSQMITAIFVAFALHFLEFSRKNTVFALIMATTMIPAETTIISNFLSITGLGLGDCYIGLVLPFLTSAMGIFLFRQAFQTFPMELYEAAKMDNCSDLNFVFRILIPLSKPTIGALSVASFLSAWNMYMWPLLVTGNDDYRTVQIGISMLNSQESQSMLLMIAGVVVCMIPSLIIFLFAQKNMVKGLTSGAVKG